MMKRLVLCAFVLSALACSSGKHSGVGDAGLLDAGTNASGNGSSGSGSGASGGGATNGRGTADGGGGTGGAGHKKTGTLVDGGTGSAALQLCGGSACQCADGIDNDGDGQTDGFDVECTGANDNDEGSFATGIPGDNVDPKWQDCFYDGNSGGGDDGCRYSTKCLTGELPQDDKNCVESQNCVDFCLQRTPNGCDCFGCCTLGIKGGMEINIVLSAKCDENDLSTCQTCVKSADCNNDCGECELCPGKTVDDLPASCSTGGGSGGAGGGGTSGGGGGTGSGGSTGGGGMPYCSNGTSCRSQVDCASTQYCSFGCCLTGPD